MSFLYHFRVLEREGARVRLRCWITSPDVLAWGAKAVPKNPRNVLSTPHFVALLLRERCHDDDPVMLEYAEVVRKSDRATQRAIERGKADPSSLGDPQLTLWTSFITHRKLASTKVEDVVNFPVPKAAWEDPANPKAAAKREAYWASYRAWDHASDPPENLARFDLTIELVDAQSMPSRWPAGVEGTTAYARM